MNKEIVVCDEANVIKLDSEFREVLNKIND